MSNIYTVILAAGKSTRYKGRKSKLLEDLGGLPIILHIHDIAKKVSGKTFYSIYGDFIARISIFVSMSMLFIFFVKSNK